MARPARVVVDLAALRHNLSRVRALAPQSRVMAILKADAYGHGIARAAQALSGADAFGVACLAEAEEVRAAGAVRPVVLLEGPFSGRELRQVADLHLEIVVHHAEQVEMLARERIGRRVPVWLKVDSGMHRLGFAPGEAAEVHRRLVNLESVGEVRLMTHLARAGYRGDAMTPVQLETFDAACRDLPGKRCIANSAAILAWPESHRDWVRPGLMLYGVSPLEGGNGALHGLKPAMRFLSEIIAVRQLRQGEPVGYGADWRCPQDMVIGVVAAGYGDGFPRHAGAGTPVLVRGRRTQIVGVASMDMLTVDLRPVPDAKVGDPVELWGENLPIEEVARHAGTVPYELLCSVQKRLMFVAQEALPDPVRRTGSGER